MLIAIVGAGALVVATGWFIAQEARRQRWVLESLDGLQVALQRHYGEICAHMAAHREAEAMGREELAWALVRVEQVLQRRRQFEREPITAPFVPRT